MTNSSFYHDGFRDATKGEKPSPPDEHNGTNVFADEYMAGYNDGMDERELESRYADTWPLEYRVWKAAQPTGAIDKTTALGVAARIWGDPDYQHVIMNPELANKIACLLMDEANSQAAQQPHAVDASPVVGGSDAGEYSGSRH